MSKTRKFALLDGMRGIAALFIALRHAPFLWHKYPETFFHESYLAVDFFFSLSGFVLMHSYAERLGKDMSIVKFIATRAVRLYPLYLLAFFVAVIPTTFKVIGAEIPFSQYLSDVFCSLFFMPTVTLQGPLFPTNPAAWSLLFEMIANIAFAFLMRFRVRYGLELIALSGFLALVIAVPNELGGFGRGFGPLDAGTNWPEFGAGLIRAGFSFFCGTLVYSLYTRRDAAFKNPMWPILALIALISVLVSWPKPPYNICLDLFFVVLVFPSVIYVSAKCRLKGIPAKLASLSGDTSYALYVLQIPFYIALLELIDLSATSSFMIEHRFITAAACTLAVSIAALLADQYFDQPLRRILKKQLL